MVVNCCPFKNLQWNLFPQMIHYCTLLMLLKLLNVKADGVLCFQCWFHCCSCLKHVLGVVIFTTLTINIAVNIPLILVTRFLINGLRDKTRGRLWWWHDLTFFWDSPPIPGILAGRLAIGQSS